MGKYPQYPSHCPVLLCLWHYNSSPYSCPYSFGNQDTIKVHFTVITANGLDNASAFRLETADIFSAEKPGNYPFSKSALCDCPLTPQSTCATLLKMDRSLLRSVTGGEEGGGGISSNNSRNFIQSSSGRPNYINCV